MSTKEERRRTPRFSASLTAVVSEGQAYYVVETVDVNETGVCLRSKKAFPVGAQYHLVFGRPPELPRLSAEGIVRWSKGGKGVGVEFTSITPDDRQAILRFVNAHSQHAQA
ncbi:MAG: PilZ domain-containing protein [Terriglobia bacterium]